ncbi:MAG: hypothetical protein ACREDU_11760 [Methylocella sp.]
MNYTKKGPGRIAAIGRNGFSPSKAAFLEVMAVNPVNRLSGRELRQLEQLRLQTTIQVWAAAEQIVAARPSG